MRAVTRAAALIQVASGGEAIYQAIGEAIWEAGLIVYVDRFDPRTGHLHLVWIQMTDTPVEWVERLIARPVIGLTFVPAGVAVIR